MHHTSLENMDRCIRAYLPQGHIEAVDLGSYDVNGSYRGLFPARVQYTGYDLEPGPGVDHVLADPYVLPMADASVDLVVSGQMLEHCPQFWRLFPEIARVLRPGGMAFVIAPSAGPIHRYPTDNYRFYPDAYTALADYAGLRLVDCWLDPRGMWRDLVGVFQKGGDVQRLTAPPVAEVVAVQNDETPADLPAAEVGQGPRTSHEVLDLLHRHLQPVLYVEIGVRHGHSLQHCRGRAVAIDPAPEVQELPPLASLHRCTSDDFFHYSAAAALDVPVGLGFIDGMHLAENVYRDFMNLEQFMDPAGVIVIDDVLPNHPLQAARIRQTRAWTGDVWRFAEVLAEMRPDLRLTWLDSFPTGLLLVQGLDPANRVLADGYDDAMERLRLGRDTPVPPRLLTRLGAVAPDDATVLSVLGGVMPQAKPVGKWRGLLARLR